MRNETITILCNAKQAFYSRLKGANKKLLWKTMKQLCKKESTVLTFSYHGTTATDDKNKADMLNQHFSQCTLSHHQMLSVLTTTDRFLCYLH